jgi:hypothetical protein
MSKTIHMVCGGEEPRIRDERIQQEIMDYEAKRLKADRYGDADAPSPYMVGCFHQDIKATTTGILKQLTVIQEKRGADTADSYLAEICHILNDTFVKLARVERTTRGIANFVPFEERFGKEAK